MQHIANLAGNKKLVLPVPAFNVINGGSHAGNKLAMQVYLLSHNDSPVPGMLFTFAFSYKFVVSGIYDSSCWGFFF